MSETRVLVIAEAGVNHNGSVDRACELIDAAATAGADVVKFQTFRAESLALPDAPKAGYQLETTEPGESQYAMLKALELDEGSWRTLADRCAERGIRFMSTAFDPDSLSFLVNEVGMDAVKVPSGEITNGPLLLAAARTGLPAILSTGMSSLDDVREALEVLAFGFVTDDGAPDEGALNEAFRSARGQAALRQRVTLLHCTTAYPAPLDTINLRAMDALASAFGLPVGYSDHSEGIVVPIAAAARGATIIEKHFTMDRGLPGPDHRASLEPDELAEMVRSIRSVERALGDGTKQATAEERETCKVVRKSLAALRPIEAGETFTPENVGPRRPGTGISPMQYWNVIGRAAPRPFRANELIEP